MASTFRRNLTANFAGKGISAAVGLVVPPLCLRLLGAEAYGLVGLYASLASLLTVVDLGLGTTLQRELAKITLDVPSEVTRARDLVRTFEVVFWMIGLLTGLGIFLAAPLIAEHWLKVQHLPLPTAIASIQVMGVFFALQWPGGLYNGGLTALQKQVSANVISLAGSLARSIGGLAVVWLVWPSVTGFFVAQACVAAIQTLASAWWLSRSLGTGPRRALVQVSLMGASWRFSAGAWGISLLGIALGQLDKLMIGKLLPLEVLGYYTMAATAAGALYYPIAPVFTSVFPIFCQLHGTASESEIAVVYHRSAQILSVLVLPAAAVLAIFPSEALLGWTGNPTVVESSHVVLALLAVGTALNGVLNVPYALMLASGWTRLNLVANVLAILFLVPLSYALGRAYGAVGIAVCWPLLNASYVLIAVPLMHRRLLRSDLSSWYREDLLTPLLAAAGGTLAVRFLIVPSTTRVGAIATVAVAGVAAVIAAVFATRFPRRWILERIRPLVAPQDA